MSKYHEIVNKLLEVEGGLFQTICDEILYLTEEDCNRIFRPGSQVGTNKTKSGTPDSYFVLSNDQYVLVEYTTQAPKAIKALVKKIKEDIDKCTDATKTGLEPEDICKLIYCCTADLTTAQNKGLITYARKKGVKLDLRGIHAMARKLSGPCVKTAKDHLRISIDTGQILTPAVFADEYYASGFSTSLSNAFFHREQEIENLLKLFGSDIKVNILTGPPGTGKSRLAMEVFKRVHALDVSIQGLCISNKNAHIHDDLRTYLAKDCPYLILVDDANRQSGHLESLLGILREKRSKKINVVITVRDYALNDTLRRCAEFSPNVIRIAHFSDDQLSAILSSKDFGLRGKSLNRVLEISKGNARLSIMAAKVYIDSGDISSLDDVAGIYDRYFESAIGDDKVFSNPDLLRSLGLLSFFFAMDLDDKDFISGLCRRFKINENNFRNSMLELERLELAESNEDLTIMKIADQVLGTYFFYRTFIRDGILDFRMIIAFYRTTHIGRIKDSINPASSTFSFEKIYSKIDPILSEYWPEISKDPEQAFNFLNLFWAFRKHDLFAYVHRLINTTPISNEEYSMDEKVQLYSYGRDKMLQLLGNFYGETNEDIHSAIGLSLEYVRKHPKTYPQFVKSLRSEFAFVPADRDSNFFRQLALWEHLLTAAKKNDLLCTSLFFNLIHEMLKSDNGIIRLRQDDMAIHTDHVLSSSNGLYHFRAITWNFIYDFAVTDLGKIEGFLLTHLEHNRSSPAKVYYFDLFHLSRLVNAYFDTENFIHCFIVRSLLDGFFREQLVDEYCAKLKVKFNCQSYQYYRMLSWDRLRDRDMYDYEFTDHEKYRKVKEIEIMNTFRFRTLDEFREFYTIILEIFTFKPGEFRGLHNSLNIILREILLDNESTALEVLGHLIETGNVTEIYPLEVYKIMWKYESFAESLYELIKSAQFSTRTTWLENFYNYIPAEKIRLDHANDFLELIETTTVSMNIMSYTLEHLEAVRTDIFQKAILNVTEREEERDIKLTLDDNFFKSYIEKIDNLNLVKKAYIMQEGIREYFDYKFEGMLKIVEQDPNFVMEFIRSIPMGYDGMSNTTYYDLNLLWDLEEAERHISDILDYLVSHPNFFSWHSSAHIFFSGLTVEQTERAVSFACEYLKRNANDIEKVDMMMDIARNDLANHETILLLTWLQANSSFLDFKEISWQNSSMSGGGGTIFNELRAERLKRVLDMFAGLGTSIYKYSDHREYLSSRIAMYRRSAIAERRHNFLYGD
jgi:hypothetical protein